MSLKDILTRDRSLESILNALTGNKKSVGNENLSPEEIRIKEQIESALEQELHLQAGEVLESISDAVADLVHVLHDHKPPLPNDFSYQKWQLQQALVEAQLSESEARSYTQIIERNIRKALSSANRNIASVEEKALRITADQVQESIRNAQQAVTQRIPNTEINFLPTLQNLAEARAEMLKIKPSNVTDVVADRAMNARNALLELINQANPNSAYANEQILQDVIKAMDAAMGRHASSEHNI